jgi:hypothetical protein
VTIESTSKSIHRARIGLPGHGRSILARRVIRRRPFCVIWSNEIEVITAGLGG